MPDNKPGQLIDCEYAEVMFKHQTIASAVNSEDVAMLRQHLGNSTVLEFDQTETPPAHFSIRGYASKGAGDLVIQVDEAWVLEVYDRLMGVRTFPETIVISKEANPKDFETGVGFDSSGA
jgi:hypothetical protein